MKEKQLTFIDGEASVFHFILQRNLKYISCKQMIQTFVYTFYFKWYNTPNTNKIETFT